jgi:hypothetical protein
MYLISFGGPRLRYLSTDHAEFPGARHSHPVRRAPPGMHLIVGHNQIPAMYSSKPGHHRSSAETKIGDLFIAFSRDCESITFEQPT